MTATNTIKAVKDVCVKAFFERVMEIEVNAEATSNITYELPKDARVAAILPGKCGATAKVTTVRSVSDTGVVTPAVLTITPAKAGSEGAGVVNSVFVVLE